MKNLDTVGHKMAALGIPWDWDVSPRDGNATGLKALEELVERALGFKIPYTRYTHVLGDVVAARMGDTIGATDLGFEGRLGNSGMSVIKNAIIANGRSIVHSNVLYGETGKWIGILDQKFGRATHLFMHDDNDGMPREGFLESVSAGGVVIFAETVGNGIPMPVLDVEAMMRLVWQKGFVTFILDGTFTTCALLNPFSIYQKLKDELGEPAFQFVYVESGSKYYRADLNHDRDTMGLLFAQPKFLEQFDALMTLGDYLPMSVLRHFPWSLMEAPCRVMPDLSANAKAAVEFLDGHPAVKRVHYPRDERAVRLLPGGAGGVIYVELWNDPDDHTMGVVTDGDEFIARLNPNIGDVELTQTFGMNIPQRASFGHTQLTCIGVLSRIAVGTVDTPDGTVKKLRDALGERD